MKFRSFLATGVLAWGLAAPAMAAPISHTNPLVYQTWLLSVIKFTSHNNEGTWERHTSGYTSLQACIDDGDAFAAWYAGQASEPGAGQVNVDYTCTEVFEQTAVNPPPNNW